MGLFGRRRSFGKPLRDDDIGDLKAAIPARDVGRPDDAAGGDGGIGSPGSSTALQSPAFGSEVRCRSNR